MEKGKKALELLREVVPGVEEIFKTPIHGVVHKRTTAEINGVKGFLVWDFIIYNEITFDDMDGRCYSFFNSVSDEETELKWNELVAKYGI